jgi:hypothetical protein
MTGCVYVSGPETIVIALAHGETRADELAGSQNAEYPADSCEVSPLKQAEFVGGTTSSIVAYIAYREYAGYGCSSESTMPP